MTQEPVSANKAIISGPTQPTKPNKSVSKPKKLDKVPVVTTKTLVSAVIKKKLMTSKELVGVSRRLLGHSIENPRNCSTFFTWMDSKAKEFDISEPIGVENNPELVLENLNVYQAVYLIFNPDPLSQILTCCFERSLSQVDLGTLVNKQTNEELTHLNYTVIQIFEKLLMRFLVCINALEYSLYLQRQNPDKYSIHEKALLVTYAKTIFSLATDQKFNLTNFSINAKDAHDALADIPHVKRKVNQLCGTLKNITRQLVPQYPVSLNITRWLDANQSNPDTHFDDTELLVHIIRAYVIKSEPLLWVTDEQQKQLLDYCSDLTLTIHMYIWIIGRFDIQFYTNSIVGQFSKNTSSIKVKDIVSPTKRLSNNQFSKLITILGIVIRTQYLALGMQNYKIPPV